tara:strand:- start:3107 stop:3721 length:615 start_codon:yes stop_codon:yes gene_type:complete
MAIVDNKIQAPFNKARKDKFLLVFNIPNALKVSNRTIERSNSTFKRDSFQFSVESSVVPDISVPAVETRYAGANIHLSSHARPPFQPVEVEFTIDNRFENYWVIYSWMNTIRDQYDGQFGAADIRDQFDGDAPLSEYSTDITLYALDEYNKPIIEWNYTRAFPVKLGGISYNYQDPDEIKSAFTFAFSNIHCQLSPTTDKSDRI